MSKENLQRLVDEIESIRNEFQPSPVFGGNPQDGSIHTSQVFQKWLSRICYEVKKLPQDDTFIQRLMGNTEGWNGWRDSQQFTDLSADLQTLLENADDYYTDDVKKGENVYSKIFISHKSDDKKYCDALAYVLRSIGLADEQIIYTSHEKHKIPNGRNIYEYLKSQIGVNTYAVFVFSQAYLQSVVCMNEMGAFWVVQSEYSNFFVPGFDFNDEKYRASVVDSDKIGVSFVDDKMNITGLKQFVESIIKLFQLTELLSSRWDDVLDRYKEMIN